MDIKKLLHVRSFSRDIYLFSLIFPDRSLFSHHHRPIKRLRFTLSLSAFLPVAVDSLASPDDPEQLLEKFIVIERACSYIFFLVNLWQKSSAHSLLTRNKGYLFSLDPFSFVFVVQIASPSIQNWTLSRQTRYILISSTKKVERDHS